MKYLYKILRLFFCPHRYRKTLKKGNIVNDDNEATGTYYDKECCYCGRVTQFSN